MTWMESPQTANVLGALIASTTSITARNGSGSGARSRSSARSSASTGASTGVTGYKRASRKGALRRFVCDHAGCDKIYSRAEHLQRHQLNHNPKEIYRCDVGDCDQKFVRLDLLSRHKKRHTASYTPRNRIPSFDPGVRSPPDRHHRQPPASGPHDAAILLTPESNTAATPAPPLSHPLATGRAAPTWAPSLDDGTAPGGIMRHRPSFYAADAPALPEPPGMVGFSAVGYAADDDSLTQGNFAAWLFDPQTTYSDFGMAGLPFLEGGLESTFNANIRYDYESLTSLSPMDQPQRLSEASADDWVAESRRQELLHWFQAFRKKQPRYEPLMPGLVLESGGDLPALSLDMMRDCLKEFWDNVSPRLPIVHQHTFSPNRCPVLLLLVMLSLGAASLRGRDPTGRLSEYGPFADVVVSCARWEILTSDDSAPPASLWVLQALLLLEFYEKLYSSRKLHERAHIYHPAFLTLLRRGSPLIGRTGSESPPEPDAPGPDRQAPNMALDSRTWWARWAETESMHRVVFAAFMLDVIHAAMFGHAADMAPHEIRLPLPCDDHLWAASSPDVVRELDANFRMYGVKQVSFLDGLKSALHGKEVKTHSFGRMIIISGLLSVGWHLNHRETHLKWLDIRTPSAEAQDGWRKMLLRAFDDWKGSFDVAMSDPIAEAPGHRGIPNGPINSASVLYHLAHISLHADIVDCQVYAGAKRLLGRRVSSRDHSNAVKRMSAWSGQGSTRHAILHAFKLLYRVVVDPRPRRRNGPRAPEHAAIRYSVRSEPDPHRPWIMYYAVLAIWAFVQALGRPPGKGFPPPTSPLGHERRRSSYARMVEYVSGVAALPELDERACAVLHEGLPDLLDVMVDILEEADTELLAEARERLKVCKEMLLGGIARPFP
ncbi:zinc c2h2 type domain-containing [Trichoderma cornu-damae]|uniref:Zinc c2h2 type domain-containing n=1 Tax=Trichoderma cornu-damae TaxID=654480 RepID=A0A9P8QU38_9HYPO|nr:zinc c2h2 type domain-containing [Trichoderma cornu-damae]